MCWYASASEARVDVGGDLVAHVGQVHRCGSVWACPVCAPVVRARRAQEIDEGLSGWLAAGHGAEFLTLTTRHHRSDALGDRLDLILTALGYVFRGSGWVRRRDRLGFAGSIRAGEVTFGLNGWHPHSHSALLFDRPLSSGERSDLRAWLFARHSGYLERAGVGAISERHGIDLRPISGASDLAQYLTKVEGGWTAGMELARADVKRKGQAPLDLLREFVRTGEVAPARLWQEYERATFGRRAIVWSKGLRALLLGSEEECSDVDAAAAEGEGLSVLRALVPADEWNASVRAGEVGELVSRIERAAAVLLSMSRNAGHHDQVLDVEAVRT